MKRIIEVRSAEGGEDAKLFATDLVNAYARAFDRDNWKYRRLTDNSIEVEGTDLSFLDNEAGGHRIQRVPPTERRGRVHTSTVTVAVLEPSQIKAVDPSQLFRIEWFSGSGSGGQHRNKHQNSCRITHIPTGITRKAETRSRQNSYQEAMNALLEVLSEKSRSASAANTNNSRKDQIGSGMRGDKRRTYRFQEDRVVDHISGRSSSCSKIMRGLMDDMWK